MYNIYNILSLFKLLSVFDAF